MIRSAYEPPVATFPNQPIRLSVEQYLAMISGGLLPEDLTYELIEGQIVRKDRAAHGEDPISAGIGHRYTVEQLGECKPRFKSTGCFLQTQQPITIEPLHRPEPDGSIVRGSNRDYSASETLAADVLVVVEVADSSLTYDREVKQKVYADAGIPVYVILNLIDDVAEVMDQPQIGRGRYGHTETLKRSQSLTVKLPKRKTITLPLRKLIAGRHEG